MLLSKVAEHVTIVTIHIPTEDFDVVLWAELVHTHHQVFGAARQAHLGTKRRRHSAVRADSHQSPVSDDTNISNRYCRNPLKNKQNNEEKNLLVRTFLKNYYSSCRVASEWKSFSPAGHMTRQMSTHEQSCFFRPVSVQCVGFRGGESAGVTSFKWLTLHFSVFSETLKPDTKFLITLTPPPHCSHVMSCNTQLCCELKLKL